MNEKVIYFSLNPDRKHSFYEYIREQRICYEQKFSFTLEGENVVFKDPRDLITIIEQNSKKDSLHIIIDYVSCCGSGNESNYAEVVRDIIMCYPEVQFLFDETFVKKSEDERNKKFNYLNFLFWKVEKDTWMAGVLAEFHQFVLDFGDVKAVKKQFIRLLKGCNNMYDGSNLRHAIKKCKFKVLDVVSNYRKLQESRSTNAVVVVEEEYHQNMFNSYCLYANGFRVVPIISATELLWINGIEESTGNLSRQSIEIEKSENGKVVKEHVEVNNAPLLIRDYDLQFVDENRVASGVTRGELYVYLDGDQYEITMGGSQSNQNMSLVKKFTLNEIDYIRGAKALKIDGADGKEIIKYLILEKDARGQGNPYWKAFADDKTYFVSKGESNIEIKVHFKKAMEVDETLLRLRGMKKPLEGIYESFRRIECVKERYDASREFNLNHEIIPFKTTRGEESGHSTPLDLYGITHSMVRRAEKYLKTGNNRLAALVAGEALEVLNGFHKSLMNEAYYIQAVAENAMAVSLLGGDEDILREDVKFRLKQKVKKDVERMIPDEEDRYNLLYNIYNDCLLFCQKKEYYDAADEALSIMVIEKDGWYYMDFLESIKDFLESIKKWYTTKFKQEKKNNN